VYINVSATAENVETTTGLTANQQQTTATHNNQLYSTVTGEVNTQTRTGTPTVVVTG